MNLILGEGGFIIAELIILGLCIVVFGLTLKLYTEYFKDRSQNRR